MWWAWWFACDEPGRGVQDAEVVACLAVPDGSQLPADGGISGVAIGDGDPDPGVAWTHGDRCAAASRAFVVEDDDGLEWTIGYGWNEDGGDATSRLAVGPLDPLEVTFVVDGAASGFVARGTPGLLAALEVGVGAWVLEGAVPGLTVRSGDPVGTSSGDCGHLRSRELVFTGATTVTLEPVSSSALSVDGQDLTVWALANTEVGESDCPDAARRAWALWEGP